MSTQPPTQQQRVPLSKEKNPIAIAVATAVRKNALLKQRQGILSTTKNKTDFFRFKRFVRAIQSDDFKKKIAKSGKNVPPIPDETNAINQVFIMLIQNQLVVPVTKLKTQDAKKQGYKIDKETPALELSTKAVLQADAYYAWNYDPPNPYMLLYSILVVCAIFTVILFPLWPFWMRKGVWYLSTGLLCLVGLFFVIAIIRLIIYLFSLGMSQQFWLFPNLFADCGVLESFKPLYEWENPGAVGKKGKKAGKNRKSSDKTTEKATEKTTTSPAPQETSTTAAKPTETSTKKRTVTLEEVRDD